MLSPAAVAFEGMTALAGTGARRHARFVAQTVDFHKTWKGFFYPLIDNRTALVPQDFDRVPAFSWQEEPPALVHRAAAIAVFQLLMPSLLLFGLAAWRLRRLCVS